MCEHVAICSACGVQYPDADPPSGCAVCDDERQLVAAAGQSWTTLERLRRDHRNVIAPEGPNLFGIGTEPSFAIGQRALLVRSETGNVLWDCLTLIDDATVAAVQALGGIETIAISHPHYYGAMVDWSRAFGDAPIWLHVDDEDWVMRPDAAIRHWHGERQELGRGLTLVRCGGHFPGGTVLHWSDGADGRGALLTGDIIQVVPDRGWVSFMYSYPNLIPLPAATVEGIVAAVEPYAFDAVYGAWWGRTIEADAKHAVRRSARRYVEALRPPEPE